MYLTAVVYCCCVLLSIVGCSCVLLCVVACYRGLLVAVCEQVLRRGGGWLLGLPLPPHHYSLGIHGCMLVGRYYSYIWPLPDGQLINTHYWQLRSHPCSNDSYRFSLSMRIEYAFSLRVQPLVVCIHKGGAIGTFLFLKDYWGGGLLGYNGIYYIPVAVLDPCHHLQGYNICTISQ